MEHTQFLAQLIGIFSLAMGLSMVAKHKMLLSIFHEIAQSRAISYILGVLMFLLGLLLILNHNIWTEVPSLIITLLGWLILIEGALYLFISKRALKQYFSSLDKKGVYYGIALIYLIIGIYLTFIGFL